MKSFQEFITEAKTGTKEFLSNLEYATRSDFAYLGYLGDQDGLSYYSIAIKDPDESGSFNIYIGFYDEEEESTGIYNPAVDHKEDKKEAVSVAKRIGLKDVKKLIRGSEQVSGAL